MPSTKVYTHYNCDAEIPGRIKTSGMVLVGDVPTTLYDNTDAFPLDGEIRANNTSLFMASLTGTLEVTEITCGADVAKSLQNKYFLINSPLHAYYVWFNVNSEGVDPGIADALITTPLLTGKQGVEVALATGANATAVAHAVHVAVDALNDFVCPDNNGAVATVTDAGYGPAPDANPGTTAWSAGSFVVTQQGNATSASWKKINWSPWS